MSTEGGLKAKIIVKVGLGGRGGGGGVSKYNQQLALDSLAHRMYITVIMY